MSEENSLLSPEEKKQCQQIARQSDLEGQRATALLALDSGATQVEAAEKSALSTGQVKYALARFKKLRLGIFPQEVSESQDEAPHQDEAPQLESAADTSAVPTQDETEDDSAEAEVLAKKEKKSKKKNKKGKKGGKKSKKAKKAKKGKKQKGGNGKKAKKEKKRK